MNIPEQTHEVEVPVGRLKVGGTLGIPDGPIGTVIFAHGSGSSRFSKRNAMVATVLRRASLATLLLDLLDEAEAEDRSNIFDIELLAGRLAMAANWVRHHRGLNMLPIGLFGASTGAAAALVAAAGDRQIAAVVSRGGRPDLAGDLLRDVHAPTLLIVGGADHGVIELNERAFEQLPGPRRLEVVPGATHLFEEPGALEQVSVLAREWFVSHLSAVRV